MGLDIAKICQFGNRKTVSGIPPPFRRFIANTHEPFEGSPSNYAFKFENTAYVLWSVVAEHLSQMAFLAFERLFIDAV